MRWDGWEAPKNDSDDANVVGANVDGVNVNDANEKFH